MLSSKYIAFFVFIYITASLLGAIMEEGYLSENETGTLNQIAFWQEISEQQAWGPWDVVGVIGNYFEGLFNIATWNFAFMRGTEWEVFRWIVCAPFTALFVYGLLMTLVGVFTRQLD